MVLQTFPADLDFDPAEYLDVLSLFGRVCILAQLTALHYFDDSVVLLDDVRAKDRIFNPYAAWDEFLWWVLSRFGGADGLDITVSVVEGLGEPGVTRFSLSYFLTEVKHQM